VIAHPPIARSGTVGTLKTGYPRIQALRQDKEQGVHPHAVTQVVASNHTSLQRWALEPPHVPRPRLLAKLSSGDAMCSSASDLASLPRWAPALPHVP
jgi:hypothetical protein